MGAGDRPPHITLLLFPGCAVNKSQTQEAADIKTCPPAWGRAPEIMSICDGSVRLAPDSDVCSGFDLMPSQFRVILKDQTELQHTHVKLC